MAAATTSASQANADILTGKIEGALRNVADGTSTITGSASGYNFGDTFALATTRIDDVGDITRLLLFPSGAYIDDFRGTITDCDSHATPTLVYDIVVTDGADVVKDTLVSASNKGQAAGTDRITAAAVGQFVGNRYLALKVTTAAATAVAGTYGIYVRFSIGVNSLAGGNEPIMTDGAF